MQAWFPMGKPICRRGSCVPPCCACWFSESGLSYIYHCHADWFPIYDIAFYSPFHHLEGLCPAHLSELSSSCFCSVWSPLCSFESTKLVCFSALRFTLHPLHLLFPQPQLPSLTHHSITTFARLVQLNIQ